MSQKISSESITCQTKGFSVAASPLNSVKLELIIILIVAGLFWLLLDGLIVNEILQVTLLGLYGITGMAWIIFRTKHILKQVSKTPNNEKH